MKQDLRTLAAIPLRIPLACRSPAAPEARAKLQAVLDRYADARPESLDRAFRKANPTATTIPSAGKQNAEELIWDRFLLGNRL